MLKRRFKSGNILEAGVDEAGRGCLAGPVAAAAVMLKPGKNYKWYSELNDSKLLNEKKRNELRKFIEQDALAWAVALASHEEIDAINILNASFLAMHRAINSLAVCPELLLIDGNRFKSYKELKHACIVKGDGKYLNIAAASILAKTHRDELMLKMHDEFPVYGWDHNKAYGTLFHRAAIDHHGLSPYHRKSFRCGETELDINYEEN